jgi:hypothetical protein
MSDHFAKHEGKKLLGKIRGGLGSGREMPETSDLLGFPFLARRVATGAWP